MRVSNPEATDRSITGTAADKKAPDTDCSTRRARSSKGCSARGFDPCQRWEAAMNSRGALASLWHRGALQAALMRAVREGALALYGFLIAMGALVHPGLSLIFGAVSGLAGGAVVAALLRHASADDPQLPHPALAAAVAGGLPAALAGSGAIGPWGGVLLVLLITVAATLFGRWISSDPRVRSSPAGGRGLGPWDEELLREVVSALPTDVLLDEWQVTQRRLTTRAGDLMWEVRLRGLLIDELQARDPVGTARWLSEGINHPPDRYIQRDSSLGS
jgi:hypothetical protein